MTATEARTSESPPAALDGAVADGLAIVTLLLEAEVRRMRAAGIPVGQDEYRGLYIAEAEADRLAAARPWEGAGGEDPATPGLRERLGAVLAQSGGPLERLRAMAPLSALEAGCLLLCLASEADLGTERLIAYVQDDVSKRRPRVDLALRLFAGPGERVAARAAFDADAPLRRLHLVTLADEPGQPSTPLLARYLALDTRVAEHLLGRETLDEALAPHLLPAPSAVPPGSGFAARLQALAALPATALQPPVAGLYGLDRELVAGAAAVLAEGAGLPLLGLSLPGLAAEHGLDRALVLAGREAALRGAALFLDGLDTLSREDGARACAALREPLAPLVVLGARESCPWPGVTVEVPGLAFDERREAWARELRGEPGIGPGDLDSLAGKFLLGAGGIGEAVRLARGQATWRIPGAPAVEPSDLHAGARSRSTPILNTLAKKVPQHYRWADIVLAADTKAQLEELQGQVEHRHLVYETWGMDRKLATSKGLMSLFAGPAGTGKTMAADVVAGSLELDLYKIDLSGVVSKYIGETEKNLASIFGEAESSNAILFFDEADALFGKRSEVKDAHDRYANIETAYLLQKMEEYSGLVVLATNLKMNLDEAFMRRFHFVIDFPPPEEDERRRIWQATVAPGVPLGKDVDFGFLARQFKLTGGHIRNIVLAAAFLAAGEGTAVGMAHFIRATRREYQKLGKMVTEAEFGPHIAHLR